MSDAALKSTIEAIFRIESPALIAGLARIVRDVGRAEELAQDAFVSALEQWPKEGLPDRPGAWLMASARHRAIDTLRRRRRLDQRQEEIARRLESEQARAVFTLPREAEAAAGEDLLQLMFVACSTVLGTEARVTLTLRLLGGLTTEEIARAFLVPEATIAQRIVRAKRTLAKAGVDFELPRGTARGERLGSVLAVLYLVFNEGYSASAGKHWTRPLLCDEALRLGRVLAGLVPDDPEVHGLVALMELQASRLAARVDAAGEPILLLDQDRNRWDRLLIRRGLEALARADAALRAAGRTFRGDYQVQAEIAACHARAATPAATDWSRIASLYAELARVAPSPIVELNRAVAVSMADGPAAGLALVDALREDQRLARYHLLPSVRGDLLAKLRRHDEARLEFERAATLTRNDRERRLLLARAAEQARA